MAHLVTDALANVTGPVARNTAKVAAFVALPNVVNTVTVGIYTVTLVARPVKAPNGCLQFNVKITKPGAGIGKTVDVTPKDMNPVRVWNPPILVDDPVGDITRTWNDPQTGIPQTRTLREDLHACLLSIASGLVRGLP